MNFNKLKIPDSKKKSGEWIVSPEYIVCNLCGMGLDVRDYTKEEQMECFKFCPCCGKGMRWADEF